MLFLTVPGCPETPGGLLGRADHDRVVALAAGKGVRPAQVALSWILHQPAVTAPIVGATKMEQLDEAVAALAVALSADDLAQLEELYEPHTVRW